MADFKPKPGSFLPFLESSNKNDYPNQQGSGSPLALLEILARQSQKSLALFDLQSLSNMDPSRYGEALKSLLAAGYITVTGGATDQTITLTGTGQDVVRIARPA